MLVKQAVQTELWVRLLREDVSQAGFLLGRGFVVGQASGVRSLVVLHQWVLEPGVCRGMALPADPADKLLCDTRLQ